VAEPSGNEFDKAVVISYKQANTVLKSEVGFHLSLLDFVHSVAAQTLVVIASFWSRDAKGGLCGRGRRQGAAWQCRPAAHRGLC
jgi:hypothetical protein